MLQDRCLPYVCVFVFLRDTTIAICVQFFLSQGGPVGIRQLFRTGAASSRESSVLST